jgi:hypothetical protein
MNGLSSGVSHAGESVVGAMFSAGEMRQDVKVVSAA